ncbi:MAG: fumarylacetoacetate hydrolase family protein [Rhodospirillales bacterium]|nr:fumarylacetoacetate hydrolase family protein [Rhodospirillales bacterium]
MTQSRRTFISASAAATVGLATAPAAGQTPAQSARPVFDVPPTHVAVAGSGDVFPVRRIYCVGRNFAEAGVATGREPPFFFQKPTDAIQYVPAGSVGENPYPSLTKNYHYEVELVCALGSGGTNISVANALRHVFGYAVGLDMTRRDLQRTLGDEKKPWEVGKSFDRSAPIGPIHRSDIIGHFPNGAISLSVNGALKQEARLEQMIWSVAQLVSKLSEAFELKAGDLIYCGTPDNVGPVVKGDRIVCRIDRLPDLSVRIV